MALPAAPRWSAGRRRTPTSLGCTRRRNGAWRTAPNRSAGRSPRRPAPPGAPCPSSARETETGEKGDARRPKMKDPGRRSVGCLTSESGSNRFDPAKTSYARPGSRIAAARRPRCSPAAVTCARRSPAPATTSSRRRRRGRRRRQAAVRRGTRGSSTPERPWPAAPRCSSPPRRPPAP